MDSVFLHPSSFRGCLNGFPDQQTFVSKVKSVRTRHPELGLEGATFFVLLTATLYLCVVVDNCSVLLPLPLGKDFARFLLSEASARVKSHDGYFAVEVANIDWNEPSILTATDLCLAQLLASHQVSAA